MEVKIVKGKYNEAKIFAKTIEEEALKQIETLCNMEIFRDSRIRVMPDVHAGKGCTIGTTITLKDKVIPYLVGVDIGCGMEVVKIKERDIDLKELDGVINESIPAGQNVRETPHPYADGVNLKGLRCLNSIDLDRAFLSIGTLGGGNHFIELNRDSSGRTYLVVHSGSRYLGKQVAEYYQNLAYEKLTSLREEKQRIIKELKEAGREKEIEKALKALKTPKIKKDLAYLENEDFENYLHDMEIVQKYASLNRKAIADEIINRLSLTPVERFTTIHNYIDIENRILRKGSISAQKGETVIIPINMRDGSIIAVGKGNPDWNCSAPHGAGRLMSRKKARQELDLEEFKKSMQGIYSTTVNEATLDEAPMAYKPLEEIIEQVQDTVEIKEVIKPVYNFKASEEEAIAKSVIDALVRNNSSIKTVSL